MSIIKPSTALIYSHEQSQHQLSPTHPMRPIRLHHMHELMRASGLLEASQIAQLVPEPVSENEILSSHTRDYVEVVKSIDIGGIVPSLGEYGFGPGDNPPRRGLFRDASLTAGGTVMASETVLNGTARNAFAPAGGMHHHAMRGYASGFGIFNDAVIAIKRAIAQDIRVLYIDIDVHHGDGVQAGLYDTDQALTISIHESGAWLFPGTGAPDETGEGDGAGYSVNIPLAPNTDDDLWHHAFDTIVPPIAHAFRPDLLFTQLGMDTHRDDPLAHLNMTTQGHNLAVQKFAAMARELDCGWVAVGGGGYDMRAVARGWTMDLGTMAEFVLPDQIPQSYHSLSNMTTFKDGTDYRQPPDFRNEVEQHNNEMLEEVKSRCFPVWGI